MNKNIYYITGICNSDYAVKGEILANYYNLVKQFVESNNQHLKQQIQPEYIIDSVIGVLNMR